MASRPTTPEVEKQTSQTPETSTDGATASEAVESAHAEQQTEPATAGDPRGHNDDITSVMRMNNWLTNELIRLRQEAAGQQAVPPSQVASQRSDMESSRAAQVSKIVVQNLLQSLPNFTGQVETPEQLEVLHRFIDIGHRVDMTKGLSEQEKLALVTPRLEGIAATWWKDDCATLNYEELETQTLSNLLEKLKRRFTPKNPLHQLYGKLLSKVQGTMGTASYVEEFTRLSGIAEGADEATLTFILLRNLRPEVRERVRARCPEQQKWKPVVEAAYIVAEALDNEGKFDSGCAVKAQRAEVEKVNRQVFSQAGPLSKQLSSTKQLIGKKRPNRNCYICGRPGHMAVACSYRQEQDRVKRRRVRDKAVKEQQGGGDTKAGSSNVKSNLTKAEVQQTSAKSGDWPSSRSCIDGSSELIRLVLDSGTERHMLDGRSAALLKAQRTGKQLVVTVANRSTTIGYCCKDLFIKITENKWLTLREPLEVPELSDNLLSTSHLNDEGMHVILRADGAVELCYGDDKIVTENHGERRMRVMLIAVRNGVGTLLTKAVVEANTSKVERRNDNDTPSVDSSEAEDSDHESDSRQDKEIHTLIKGKTLLEWHEVFAHAGHRKLKAALKQVDPRAKVSRQDVKCHPCTLAKQTAKRLQKKPTATAERYPPMCMIHADLVGPITPLSLGHKRFVLNIIEDHSRLMRVYLLSAKSADLVAEALEGYINWAKNVTKQTPQILRTDNGTEFCNENMREVMRRHGIDHQTTTVYTPSHNGTVERANRTLFEGVRAALIASRLPSKLWGELCIHYAYVYNHTPHRSIDEQTPASQFFPTKDPRRVPNLTRLAPAGSRVTMLTPKEKRTSKLEANSQVGWYVGICQDQPGIRMWQDRTDKILTSSNVIIDSSQRYVQAENATPPLADLTVAADDDEDKREYQVSHIVDEKKDKSGTVRYRVRWTGYEEADDTWERRDTLKDTEALYQWELPRINCPVALRAHVDDIENDKEEDAVTTYDEAMRSSDKEKWTHAMIRELEAIDETQTWDVVPRPKQRKVVTTKWVLRIKWDQSHTVPTYKARLVARGFSQVPGLDFADTFSPTVTKPGLRLVLAVAVQLNLTLHTIDCKNAFLNGEIDRELYVEQPKGFLKQGTTRESHVCLLRKALYGLKQSPLIWNKSLHRELAAAGYIRCENDPCIYIHVNKWSSKIIAAGNDEQKRANAQTTRPLLQTLKQLVDSKELYVIVAIYVDDITIAGRTPEAVEHAKRVIGKAFSIKDEGLISRVLGLEFIHGTNGSLLVHQDTYIRRIIEEAKRSDLHHRRTPMCQSGNLAAMPEQADEPSTDQTEYRKHVGELLYAATSCRPDIAFSTGVCSRFVETPKQSHAAAVKSIHRYLNGTTTLGLLYKQRMNSTGKLHIVAYADSDHAGERRTSRSTLGYAITLNECLIDWKSQKQRSTATSTVEAEYVAGCITTKEVIWLQRLLEEIVPVADHPTPIIHMDSEGAIQLCSKEQLSERTKHIRCAYHFIRECHKAGLVELRGVRSADNLADLFTKPLDPTKFEGLGRKLGLIRADQLRRTV